MRQLLFGLALLYGFTPQASADVRIHVSDADGHPVAGVAVLVRADGPVPDDEPRTAVINQRHMQFTPNFIVVQTGTQISFPNTDSVMHHVYSFSPAKTFELPVYQGMSYAPVMFDQPGHVVLGCNIHDNMIGHILVVDTPWSAMTDDDGDVDMAIDESDVEDVKVWHPELPENLEYEILRADAAIEVTLKDFWGPLAVGEALSWGDPHLDPAPRDDGTAWGAGSDQPVSARISSP